MDFLDRLAVRSLRPGANLRPRLQPIFEAAPIVAEEPLPGAPSSRRPSVEEALRSPVRAGMEETVEKRILSETHRTQVTELTDVVTEIRSIDEEPERPATPLAERKTEEPLAPRAAQEAMAEPPQVIVREGGTPVVSNTAVSTVTQVLQILPERANVPPTLLTVPSLKGAPVAPMTASEPEPKAPDIEIHIGRVEVRAQFAATAPKREAPKPKGPSVTLDQYLEGRR